MRATCSVIMRLAVIVAVFAADSRGLPQAVSADDGARATSVSLVIADCSHASCCGGSGENGSCCCCVEPEASASTPHPEATCCSDKPLAGPADDVAEAGGCRCSARRLPEVPRLPVAPANPPRSEHDAAASMTALPSALADVPMDAGALSRPRGKDQHPRPQPLLQHLAALCCWRT